MQNNPVGLSCNWLLQALPRKSRAALLTAAMPILLTKEAVLFEPEDKPPSVHFLMSGLAKLVLPTVNGDGVECGLIGREGLPESLHLQGSALLPVRGLVAVPTTALRVPFEMVQNAFHEDEAFRRAVLHLNQVQTAVALQITSCNALHDIKQRLSRLLLTMSDRLSSAAIPVTQECLGRMIGVQRTSVTDIAGELHRSRTIDYARGTVKILNRTQLQRTACGCYSDIHRISASLYKDSGQGSFATSQGPLAPTTVCATASSR